MSMPNTKPAAVVADRLLSFFQRIERLIAERDGISSDIRDVFAEAKGVGYDIKTMRKVLALRKLNAADRDEQLDLIDTYLHALGMIDRVQARISAGESMRDAAAAEGVSKSTAHRMSQKMTSDEIGTGAE